MEATMKMANLKSLAAIAKVVCAWSIIFAFTEPCKADLNILSTEQGINLDAYALDSPGAHFSQDGPIPLGSNLNTTHSVSDGGVFASFSRITSFGIDSNNLYYSIVASSFTSISDAGDVNVKDYNDLQFEITGTSPLYFSLTYSLDNTFNPDHFFTTPYVMGNFGPDAPFSITSAVTGGHTEGTITGVLQPGQYDLSVNGDNTVFQSGPGTGSYSMSATLQVGPVAFVPEPNTTVMACLGFVGLCSSRRRASAKQTLTNIL